jgi:hypothetical protein
MTRITVRRQLLMSQLQFCGAVVLVRCVLRNLQTLAAALIRS